MLMLSTILTRNRQPNGQLNMAWAIGFRVEALGFRVWPAHKKGLRNAPYLLLVSRFRRLIELFRALLYITCP